MASEVGRLRAWNAKVHAVSVGPKRILRSSLRADSLSQALLDVAVLRGARKFFLSSRLVTRCLCVLLAFREKASSSRAGPFRSINGIDELTAEAIPELFGVRSLRKTEDEHFDRNLCIGCPCRAHAASYVFTARVMRGIGPGIPP